MKLNPEKCMFEVPSGKLLGFLISSRGIEANPNKIRAIDQMRSLTRLKDVQKLTCCVATLSRFISRMGEKGLSLFKLLKKIEWFLWMPEAEVVFQDLKRYLSFPPVLTAPRLDEELLLYVATTPQVASAVLVIEREGLQRPIYYVSEVLHKMKARYP